MTDIIGNFLISTLRSEVYYLVYFTKLHGVGAHFANFLPWNWSFSIYSRWCHCAYPTFSLLALLSTQGQFAISSLVDYIQVRFAPIRKTLLNYLCFTVIIDAKFIVSISGLWYLHLCSGAVTVLLCLAFMILFTSLSKSLGTTQRVFPLYVFDVLIQKVVRQGLLFGTFLPCWRCCGKYFLVFSVTICSIFSRLNRNNFLTATVIRTASVIFIDCVEDFIRGGRDQIWIILCSLVSFHYLCWDLIIEVIGITTWTNARMHIILTLVCLVVFSLHLHLVVWEGFTRWKLHWVAFYGSVITGTGTGCFIKANLSRLAPITREYLGLIWLFINGESLTLFPQTSLFRCFHYPCCRIN